LGRGRTHILFFEFWRTWYIFILLLKELGPEGGSFWYECFGINRVDVGGHRCVGRRRVWFGLLDSSLGF
jgi:hypothetical protein